MSIIRWTNLEFNKCPMCGSHMRTTSAYDIINCEDNKCGFKITIKRCKEILEDMRQKKLNAQIKDHQEEEEEYYRTHEIGEI